MRRRTNNNNSDDDNKRRQQKKKNKSKDKDNVVPFNKPKIDNEADEKLKLRESEKDRLNTVLRQKCDEIIEIIDTSQIDKQWGIYAALFHVKQMGVFNLHTSDYDLANKTSSDEIMKNQREYLQTSFPQFVNNDENSEETTKKVLH